MIDVDLTFSSLKDFEPGEIAKRIPELAKMLKARNELKELVTYMDGKIAAQEGAWRGLHHLVSNTETNENLKIRFINISKNELGRTLRHYKGVAWDQSPLFKKIYEQEFGQFGGEPFGCLVGDYEFDHSPHDVALLTEMAKIAAAAHSPFISAAAIMHKPNAEFTPNLFARISKNRKSSNLSDSIQDEVVSLLSAAVRGGRPGYSEALPVWKSVLNYGLPSLPLLAEAKSDPAQVISHLHKMLPVFEPRMDASTLHVRLLSKNELGYSPPHFEMLFEIEAQTLGKRNRRGNFRSELPQQGIARTRRRRLFQCRQAYGAEPQPGRHDGRRGRQGAMSSFFDSQLAQYVDTASLPWKARRLEGLSGNLINPQIIRSYEQAKTIRDTFFTPQGQLGFSMVIRPVDMDASIGEAILEIGGEQMRYTHGSSIPKKFDWSPSNARMVVRLQLRGLDGRIQHLEYLGSWAIFKFFDAGERKKFAEDKQELVYRTPLGSVTFEFQALTNDFPLWSSALSQFRCPSRS